MQDLGNIDNLFQMNCLIGIKVWLSTWKSVKKHLSLIVIFHYFQPMTKKLSKINLLTTNLWKQWIVRLSRLNWVHETSVHLVLFCIFCCRMEWEGIDSWNGPSFHDIVLLIKIAMHTHMVNRYTIHKLNYDIKHYLNTSIKIVVKR